MPQRPQPGGLIAWVLVVCAVVTVFNAPERLTGDALEYVTRASLIGHGAWADSGMSEVPAGAARQEPVEFVHFWLYPAVAAPFVATARAAGGTSLVGFRLLHVLLVLSGTFIVGRRYSYAAAVFLFLGPLLWWVDKAQVELLTVWCLAVGLAVLPRWAGAALAFSVASTQNPPLAVLVLACAVMTRIKPQEESGRRVKWVAACALAVLHPIYYWSTIHRWTPLVWPGDLRIPGVRALLTPIVDLNLGLAFNAPLACACVVASILVLAWRWRAPWREHLVVATAIVCFPVAFAQAPNVNSGGTPSMTRYALWLLPLALPLFDALRERHSILAWTLAGATVAWTAVYFPPSAPEAYLMPTRAASYVWSRWPNAENPIPEVFAERLRHRDGVNLLAATNDCQKVLVAGGEWPTGCMAVDVPPPCRSPGQLCYANRGVGGRYSFCPTSRRGGIRLSR
jgi:hypothetical protein